MKKLLLVVGTRPNFIKITQFKKVCPSDLDIKIVHTGQHYDSKMADVFFKQFQLFPDFFLNISPASANTQMAEIMLKLESTINNYKPDLVMVPGDVNSTFAAAITANKMNVKVAHIESGLRSFDRTMPEEINRILTDEVADYFFVTEQSGIDNLIKEGKNPKCVFFVGNTMIDTLLAFEREIQKDTILNQLNLSREEFVLMTMHRPATVDNLEGLNKLIRLIEMISLQYKIVFPVHPRTINKIKEFGLNERVGDIKKLILTEPLNYFSFQKLIYDCKFIITDSGGIQEESTFRQKPCFTLRPNTERPSTVEIGSNTLVPFDLEKIKLLIAEIEAGTYKKGDIPQLWDGRATERIVEIVNNLG